MSKMSSPPYAEPFTITEKVSNNALSFEERARFHAPQLHVPAVREGGEIERGSETAFEEVDEGVLISCQGLKDFVRLYHPQTGAPITVVDNHNHALYFWLEALHQKKMTMGLPLIHVDQHKDMRDPGIALPPEALTDPQAAFEFTNTQVNVGNFIVPALRAGVISEVQMLDSDASFAAFQQPLGPYILDIDIDVFAPELDYMDRPRIRAVIQKLFVGAACVTIATSPYFISFEDARRWIHILFEDAAILDT